MKKISFLIAVAAFLIVTSAQAEQGSKGDWEIGPEFGAGFPDSYNGLNPDPGFLLGVRGSYAFSDRFGLEPSFHRVNSGVSGNENIHFDSYRVNLLWNLHPHQNFRPFLTLGAGLERALIPTGVEKQFAPNAGIGMKYYFSRFGGLRIEGRYVPVKVGGVIDGWQNNFEAIASFFITLACRHEKKEAAPAPVATPTPTLEATAIPSPTPEVQVTPAPAPTPEAASETKARGILKGVTFKLKSNELTEGSKKILDDVAVELKQFPAVQVEVQGHTDTTGSAQTNETLSRKRAEAVTDYLVGRGIPKERLTAKGYGSSQPVADNKTAEGRKANRRVELKWLGE
jgi:outer membrane protein OmpA-like peptidoglycan-associated protein